MSSHRAMRWMAKATDKGDEVIKAAAMPQAAPHAGKGGPVLPHVGRPKQHGEAQQESRLTYPREIAVALRLWTRRDIDRQGPTTRGGA